MQREKNLTLQEIVPLFLIILKNIQDIQFLQKGMWEGWFFMVYKISVFRYEAPP